MTGTVDARARGYVEHRTLSPRHASTKPDTKTRMLYAGIITGFLAGNALVGVSPGNRGERLATQAGSDIASPAPYYAWFTRNLALGLNFTLAFLRAIGPDEVLTRLGGSEPVEIGAGPAGNRGSHDATITSTDLYVSHSLVQVIRVHMTGMPCSTT